MRHSLDLPRPSEVLYRVERLLHFPDGDAAVVAFHNLCKGLEYTGTAATTKASIREMLLTVGLLDNSMVDFVPEGIRRVARQEVFNNEKRIRPHRDGDLYDFS